ncbi:hypothetical protein [uncultured Oribacterium sp.]|uniref:hypothetical protein n=1 Tax=uncultured Oribacterium sp. TaxID=462198 RepID=UPI002803E47A|nr:hypothetical protein [uncultured Oribacterium sp.]
MMNFSNFSQEQQENGGVSGSAGQAENTGNTENTGNGRYKLMQYLPFFVLFVAILLLFLMFLQRKSNAVGKEEAFSSDYSRAYGSYLAHLEEKGEAISSYVWQYSGQDTEDAGEEAEQKEGKTVLLWDIFGDDTPELLYIEGNSGKEDGRVSQADLQVYSFVGGKLEPLCTMDSLDVFAGGGVNYTLFQIQGEKTLYLYREEYDGQMLERLYRLNNGSLPLSFEEIASHSYEAFGGEDAGEEAGENVGESVGETAVEGSSGQYMLHGKEVKEQDYLTLWEGLKKKQSRILLSNGKNSKFEDSQDTVDVMQKTEDKASNTLAESQKPENQPEKSTDSSENTAKKQKNSINQPVTASVKNIALSYNEALFFLQGQILKEGDDSDILLESLPDSLLLSILENLEQGSPSTGEVNSMEILSVKKEAMAYRILLKFISESFSEEQYRSCLVAENAGEQGLTFTVQNMAEASAEEKSKMESQAQALQEEVAEQAGEGTDTNGDGQAVEVAPQTEAVPAETEAPATTAATEAVNNASANQGTWKEQFYDYIWSKRYATELTVYDDPVLALYDITNDGTPELLIGTNIGATYSYTCFIKYSANGAKVIDGAMDVHAPTAYAEYSKGRKVPGLFGSTWYRGEYKNDEMFYHEFYFFYDGGKINSTEVYTFGETEPNTQVTNDSALFAASQDTGWLEYYPLSEVKKMGWDNFVKKYPY